MINLDILTAPFPRSDVKQLKKKWTDRSGNQKELSLDYIDHMTCVDRLNDAFDGAWSLRVLNHQAMDDSIIVLAEIEADGIVKQGFGGASLRDGQAIEDSYKSALSDAMKVAASKFGVARELYGRPIKDRTEPSTPDPTENFTQEDWGMEPETPPAPETKAVSPKDFASPGQRAFMKALSYRSYVPKKDKDMMMEQADASSLLKSTAKIWIDKYVRWIDTEDGKKFREKKFFGRARDTIGDEGYEAILKSYNLDHHYCIQDKEEAKMVIHSLRESMQVEVEV